jgi:hypothetical protein
MGEAVYKIEGPIRTDSPCGTGNRTDLAVQTRVVVQRTTVLVHLGINKHSIEQDKTPEHWMNNIAVEAYLSEASGYGYRLVRYDLYLARPLVRFHRKSNCRSYCTNAFPIECCCQCVSSVV